MQHSLDMFFFNPSKNETKVCTLCTSKTFKDISVFKMKEKLL